MIQYNRTQPLTTVRSPVRGASDSVSRHDGPHQQGGTERPAQHGSVKAREASTLGGYQGLNHTITKQLNQTHQNTDNHYISSPPSRHIAPITCVLQQILPTTYIPYRKHPPTLQTTQSHSPTAVPVSYTHLRAHET